VKFLEIDKSLKKKKLKKLWKFSLILTSLILSLLIIKVALAGFGISPPYVKNDNLTRGSHFEQKIVLVRGDPIEDWKVEIKADIPLANNWVSIDKGTEFILPMGEKQFPILVKVDVPNNAEYGEYKGKISIRTSSLKPPQGGTVAIALGAQIDVDLKVVKKGMVDFVIRGVRSEDTVEGIKNIFGRFIPAKIKFLMQLENKSNIKAAPSKVAFEIYDSQNQKLLEKTAATRIAEIPAFAIEWATAYLPTKLLAGSYWANYQIYNGEQMISDGRIHLSILPKGALPSAGPSFWEMYGLELIILVSVIILAVLVIFFIRFLRLKKKRKIKIEIS